VASKVFIWLLLDCWPLAVGIANGSCSLSILSAQTCIKAEHAEDRPAVRIAIGIALTKPYDRLHTHNIQSSR